MSELRVIRPAGGAVGRRQLGYFLGVSAETCGSSGLAMHLVVVPPGASAEPHYHDGYETAIYQLRAASRRGTATASTSRSSRKPATSCSSRPECRIRR